MLTSVVSRMIEDEFDYNIEKASGKGMVFTLDLHVDYNVEDGYRFCDVIIFAPQNYVKVLVRERWNVVANGDTEYVKGATRWFKIGDHDSCWRQSVRSIFEQYGNDIVIIRRSRFRDLEDASDILTEGYSPHGPWYSTFAQTDELRHFTMTLDHANIDQVRDAGSRKVTVKEV